MRPRRERFADAARALRGDLPELGLGWATSEIDAQLAELVIRLERGEAGPHELHEFLQPHETAWQYVLFFVARGYPPDPSTGLERKGITPLPGDPGVVPARKWSCPEGDFDWYQRRPGQRPPRCPTHDLELVPAE